MVGGAAGPQNWARCPDCGARLPGGRPAGERCDLCQSRDPRRRLLVLPAGFYDRPLVAGALADLDFGPVIRAVRIQTGWSQQTLGTYLGMTQARISNIENGKRSITDLRTGIRVINLLMVPAASVGVLHGVTVGSGTLTERGGWMECRRDFIHQAAGLALGSGASGVSEQLDLDRLAALLHADPPGVRVLGEADVAALERANAYYGMTRHRFGGGYAREVAAAHLRATLPLLADETAAPELRARLHAATAHLALGTGWMYFDGLLHEPARRMWLAGLRIAKGADDPITTDLIGHLLFIMAHQSLEVARPGEALQLVRFGQAVAEGSPSVSPSTSTALAVNLAFAHAARGDRQGFSRALGDAEEAFTGIDPTATAPWACVNGPKFTTWQGHAYYELGRASGDPGSLTRALSALTTVTENPDLASRALYLPDLAGAYALTGDIDTAVTVGHQAIDVITSMHSRRAYQRLDVLRDVLEPMSASPGVTELRQRLAGTTAG